MNKEAFVQCSLKAASARRAILISVVSVLALCPLWLRAQSVTLAWNPSPSSQVTGYTLFYSQDGINFPDAVTAGTNTSVTVSNLQSGVTYYFEVVAYNGSYESLPSNLTTYTVPAAVMTLTVQAAPSDAGNVTGSGLFTASSFVTVTATAASGYTFANWTANGIVQSTSSNYSFTLATNSTLIANFTANPVNYTVATQSSPANAGIVTGGGAFVTGTSLTVTASAHSGYTFTNWMENGIVQSVSPNYSFTLAANRNLVANFTANPVTYTVATQSSPANAGTVTGGGAFVAGTSLTVTATVHSSYTFTNWTENGIVQSASSNYSFTLTANRNLVANFTANPVIYTVTSSAGKNGGISPNGPQTVVTGGNVVFTAAPSSGYQVNQWLVNGTLTQTGGMSYTLQNVTNNAVVSVTFSANPVVAASSFVGTTVVSNASSGFALLVSGDGTISPQRSAQAYQTGRTYTLTASPVKGSVLANWISNGVVVATTPKFTFTAAPNLVLQANFIPNPFIPSVGTYHGLFWVTNDVAEENCGSFIATVSSTGAFSAKLHLGAQNYSFSSAFSTAGVALKSIQQAQGLGPITIQLELDLATNGPMTGTISNGAWTADLVADPAIYSAANPTPQAGKYTLLIPGSTNASEPGGPGFGAITVNPSGNVTVSGMLGDGTSFTTTSVVSSNAESGQGQWPLYASLYGGKGSILGWLSFTNVGSITGQVAWIKLPQTTARLYPDGFTNRTDVIGSPYQYTNGPTVLGFTDGQLLLTDGNLSQTITNQIVDSNNEATGPDAKLTFKASSGLFKGSVMNPATGQPIAVNGIVLQNQNIGAGFFLGTAASGNVLLSSAQ